MTMIKSSGTDHGRLQGWSMVRGELGTLSPHFTCTSVATCGLGSCMKKTVRRQRIFPTVYWFP